MTGNKKLPPHRRQLSYPCLLLYDQQQNGQHNKQGCGNLGAQGQFGFKSLGLGLAEGEKVTVSDAEWCSVTFPDFFEVMNKIGAGFETI